MEVLFFLCKSMKKSKLIAGYLLGIAAAYVYAKSQENDENEEKTTQTSFFDYFVAVHRKVFCVLEEQWWTSKNKEFLREKKEQFFETAQEYGQKAKENWKEYLEK